jgi:hypothetical protein
MSVADKVFEFSVLGFALPELGTLNPEQRSALDSQWAPVK